MKSLFLLLLLPLACLSQEEIQWTSLSSATVEEAKKEEKIILLNLEANWCHWCHVMHDSTYSNPEIISYINAHFIAVKADQDILSRKVCL